MPETGPTRLYNTNHKKEHNIFKARARLRDNEKARRVFIAIAKLEPCFAHQIKEHSEVTKTDFYNAFQVLKNLGICKRIGILEIKNPKNWVEKEALKKWDEFSKNMPESTKNYFFAKTGIYYVTEFGNNEDFIKFVCNLEDIKELPGNLTNYNKENKK